MQEVQLYIQGEKVDLFNDESISLTQVIQDVKDISKVFTDFSKAFNLPASKTNNKIFKHYYNYNIVDGFDARYKVDALIKLNGIDYRKGKLRLNGVDLEDGVANSYKVVFFGETVSLSDVLGDDELDVLADELSKFNQVASPTNTLQGLKNGFDLVGSTLTAKSNTDLDTGDLIYPFISPATTYYYNKAETNIEGNNLYTSNPSTYLADVGLNWLDLKPALKVRYIIDAIATRYNLTFSNDFFSSSNTVYEELYLWMHREKGNLNTQVDSTSFEIKLAEWDLSLPEGEAVLFPELRIDGNTALSRFFTTNNLEYTINVVGSGLYNLKVIDNEQPTIIYANYTGLSGNQIKDVELFPIGNDIKAYPKVIVSTQGGISAFNISLNITQTTSSGVASSDYTFDSGVNQALSSGLIIGDNMPKMKIIDFLSSIFKMFNLTAYYKDGVIEVKHLDSYYNSGSVRDITKYIDPKKTSVERNKIYSTIDFNYEKPETLFTIKSNEFTNNEFGNLKYNSDSDTYDGGKYEVKANFEHTIYERIVDDSDDVITDYSWGAFLDKDQEPILGKPLLFFASKVFATQTAYLNTGSSLTSFDRYMRASNVLEDGTQTLNFGSEVDEFTLDINNESLFKNFYSNYIAGVFDVDSRIIKYKAQLPLSFLLSYNLSDTILVKGARYKINSIDTNLQTGESSLELINYITEDEIIVIPNTTAYLNGSSTIFADLRQDSFVLGYNNLLGTSSINFNATQYIVKSALANLNGSSTMFAAVDEVEAIYLTVEDENETEQFKVDLINESIQFEGAYFDVINKRIVIDAGTISGGGVGNIDGCSANSIYLASQNVDGGTATAITSGIIEGNN